MYTITIKEHDGWYNCKIGCQHHFFLTVEGMTAELCEYVKDPKGVEEQWGKFQELTRKESIPEGPAMDRELIRRRRLAEAKDTEGMGIINGNPEPNKGTDDSKHREVVEAENTALKEQLKQKDTYIEMQQADIAGLSNEVQRLGEMIIDLEREKVELKVCKAQRNVFG